MIFVSYIAEFSLQTMEQYSSQCNVTVNVPCPIVYDWNGRRVSGRFTPPWVQPMSVTTLGRVHEHSIGFHGLDIPDHPWLFYAGTRSSPMYRQVVDVFHRFWSSDIMDIIVNSSSRRMAIDDESASTSDDDSDETTDNRHFQFTSYMLDRFTAVLLLMGQVQLPHESDYWGINVEGDSFVSNAINTIQQTMSYDEFTFIRQNIAFVGDSSDRDSADPNRMDWLVNSVLGNGREIYHPSKYLTIDDQSIAYQGRYSRIEGKRVKKSDAYAIPFDSINDSCNGYTLSMFMKRKANEWNDMHWDDNLCDEPDVGVLPHRVMALVNSACPGECGYHITMDNEYATPVVFDELAKRGMTATGTVKQNRLTFSPQGMRLKKTQQRQLNQGMCIMYMML